MEGPERVPSSFARQAGAGLTRRPSPRTSRSPPFSGRNLRRPGPGAERQPREQIAARDDGVDQDAPARPLQRKRRRKQVQPMALQQWLQSVVVRVLSILRRMPDALCAPLCRQSCAADGNGVKRFRAGERAADRCRVDSIARGKVGSPTTPSDAVLVCVSELRLQKKNRKLSRNRRMNKSQQMR